MSLTGGARWADTLILVDQVNAAASILARAALALLDLHIADGASEARFTLALVAGDAILADAMMAGLGVAVVNILLTKQSLVTCQKSQRRQPLHFQL